MRQRAVGSGSWQLAVRIFTANCFCLLLLLLSGCAELEKPKPEPFYAETEPPQKKEFRWSNGKMPKSFDPALAASSPETDIVRAIFEGLTDTNPQTLEAVPAIAVKWEASEDYRTWTFYLRKDAKWSNGKNVTAADFERSWKRLAEMGTKVSHYKLLQNIVGIQSVSNENLPIIETKDNDIFANLSNQNINSIINTNTASNKAVNQTIANTNQAQKKENEKSKLGIEVIDNLTLRVSLINPDRNFPALVAHPMFRPIYGSGKDFEGDKLNPAIVTNGAFRIASIGQEGITLDRAEHFWNQEQIEIERVRFIPAENAEKALQSYRAGEVDAVTNVEFAPLVLKLLEPYDDFHRTTHAALNFYEFNLQKPPFNDRRVREALTISIERERLTEGTTEGATKPALSFFPFDTSRNKLTQDIKTAKNLLAEAGFPNGENFPPIKLVINRNDIQHRIARSVKQMWEQNLNIETEIIIKDAKEIESVVKSGDFDILRRGEVFPTANETANLLSIFPPKELRTPETNIVSSESETTENKEIKPNETENSQSQFSDQEIQGNYNGKTILTEEQAINELPAIPLYFPTSYSLVKPYIQGFQLNSLDAPSLKEVKIDNNWQPKKTKKES